MQAGVLRGASLRGSWWETQRSHVDSSLSSHGPAHIDLWSWAARCPQENPGLGNVPWPRGRSTAAAAGAASSSPGDIPLSPAFAPGGRPWLSQSDAGVPSRRRPIHGQHLLETRNP